MRTVDLTASPIHRALGLVTLRVGTGQSTDKGEDRLLLDGLSVAAAEELRGRLLHVSAAADPEAQPGTDRQVVLTIDPGWVRFAPLTSSGVVIAGAALGVCRQAFRTLEWTPSVDTEALARLGVTLLVLGGLGVVVVVLCLLAVAGYLVTNFGFRLSRLTADGSWHLRRGLFTTRETSLDDARVSGVSIGEPLSLRLAGGARLSAIVTGLGRKEQGSSVLVPPAPRDEVDRVAAEVLGSARPGHGAAGRARAPRRTPSLDAGDAAGPRRGRGGRGRGVRLDGLVAARRPAGPRRSAWCWPPTGHAASGTPSSTATSSPARAASPGAARPSPRRR